MSDVAMQGAQSPEPGAGTSAPVNVPVSAPVNAPMGAPEPEPRPSGRLKAGITAFVLAFGVAGYAWLGNFDGLQLAPGERGGPQAEAGAGHSMDANQFAAIADQLAERLKSQPDDAEGWTMLGRSYAVLDRRPEAAQAFKRVLELRPTDAQAHADYADALGMANGQSLEGEPMRLIDQALKLDPRNLKALALAGTVAFQKGDYAGAIGLWERGIQASEPGSELARSLQSGIEDARQRAAAAGGAGVAATQGAPVATAPAADAAPAAAGTAVSGRVSLAAALKDKAGPEDTVFIFARAAQGPRMPLAILRKQVKDLPLDFTLDDSMAMSPAARISGAPMVVVGARISKSGNAMPQPGDLEGLSAPVKPGAKGLAIEIREALR